MIRAALLILLAVTASDHVLAQQLQDRAAAAERRWADYQEMLESSNPVARAEALRAALADENLGIRTNALWTVLRWRNTLPLTVVLEPGGRIGPGEEPSPGIPRVHWDPEQRTFTGLAHSFAPMRFGRCAIVDGKLQIRYGRLKMPIRFGSPPDVPLTQEGLCVAGLRRRLGDQRGGRLPLRPAPMRGNVAEPHTPNAARLKAAEKWRNVAFS
jgi:hypothetical protein